MNDQEQHIEAYFDNELNDAEKKLFEERCVHDEVFAKDVAFYIMTREAARQKLLENKKHEWLNNGDDTAKERSTSMRSFSIKKWMPYAAAACLILFVALYFLYPAQTPDRLADKYINEHLIRLSQTMNASKDSLQKGIAAYNNKDYKIALQLFQQFQQSHPQQKNLLKYSGLVYLVTKDYNNALQSFNKLADVKSLYGNPGMFYKAITLLKRNEKNDKAQAKQLLKQVADNKEEGSKEAEEWLKKW